MHRNVRFMTAVSKYDAVVSAEKRPSEQGAGPPACQVFQEAEEGAFPVIQRHIIHVLEQSWVFESSQLGVHISATQDDDGRW